LVVQTTSFTPCFAHAGNSSMVAVLLEKSMTTSGLSCANTLSALPIS
jgi:hypothetical protein